MRIGGGNLGSDGVFRTIHHPTYMLPARLDRGVAGVCVKVGVGGVGVLDFYFRGQARCISSCAGKVAVVKG